jgi:two-component system CheB/CheR fusion protein
MLLTHRDLFAPVDLRNRVFAKVATPALREGLYVLAEPGDTAQHLAQQVRLRELAGDQVPVAQLVIDAHGTLVSANRVARRDLGIAQAEIGKPLADIEVSYRPAELVPAVRDSARQRRAIALPPVEHRLADGSRRHYHVNVIPLVDDDGADVGTVVYFTDITEYRHVSDELERSRQEIETAYEELQSSNEELETTNEELQSTVEELETTNEELQSSNEELETMNEELESTNSELQAINTDLRVRTEEIDRLNVFLESILGSVNLGVVVLDRDRRVAIWNSRATDLWGVRGDEAIGNDFFGLDIGLPLDRLAELVAGVEAGHVAEPEVVSAVNRRGREIRCRISAAPMPPASDGRGGVILLMEDIAAASAR